MPDDDVTHEPPVEEKQCRICLDSEVPELGRLIRPCLCRGSISYVHVKCLQKWRTSSANKSAFFVCPQCKYQYHFARAKVFGIATNPVIVGAISSLIFTILVLLSSFITTYFINYFSEPSYGYSYGYYYSLTSPLDVGGSLVRAALRILKDDGTFESPLLTSSKIPPSRSSGPLRMPTPRPEPGLFMRLIHRFILGLPIVSAFSVVSMLLSWGLLGPVHWLARWRGNRRNNNRGGNNRDVAALLILVLMVVGAARALWKVYNLTEKYTKRLLLRAEDAILEVN